MKNNLRACIASLDKSECAFIRGICAAAVSTKILPLFCDDQNVFLCDVRKMYAISVGKRFIWVLT